MPAVNPLEKLHAEREAIMLPYERAGSTVNVAGAFDAVPVEYAALRTACGVLDLPHHAVIEISGADRIDFLQRMVTQDVKELRPGMFTRAFWLSRKGRIEGDLLLAHLQDSTLVDVEVHAARTVADSLASYLFSEDVAIRYEEGAWHRLSLIGPAGIAPLVQAGCPDIAAGSCAPATIDGAEVVVLRDDRLGVPGFEIFVKSGDAERVYKRIVDAARPVGWLAYNILRIEAGIPVFGVDFGTSALPAETGLLHERVSFKKGCYLGQEVVARMYSLGKPKQVVASLRFEGDPARDQSGLALVPEAGSPIYAEGDDATQIGTITSATLSPMLGSEVVALATIKTLHSEPGTTLRVETGGFRLRTTVQKQLRFVH